jgi:hypothetical protein
MRRMPPWTGSAFFFDLSDRPHGNVNGGGGRLRPGAGLSTSRLWPCGNRSAGRHALIHLERILQSTTTEFRRERFRAHDAQQLTRSSNFYFAMDCALNLKIANLQKCARSFQKSFDELNGFCA